MPDNAADLETLLNQYDETAGAPDPIPNAELGKITKAIQPVVDYVNQDIAEKQQKQVAADVKGVVDFFSEDEGLKAIPDKMKRGFLEVHAQENAGFGLAFDNKAKDPKAWETAREAARDAFTEMVSELPGSKVRTDVAAALASVDVDKGTSASNDRLSPVKKMNMTYHEWREYKEEQERLAELA